MNQEEAHVTKHVADQPSSKPELMQVVENLVRLEGFEPPTCCSGGYGRAVNSLILRHGWHP
jgi:hypothetical protein